MVREGLSAVITAEGEEMTAALTGEIDHHTAGAVRKQVDEALFKHRPRRLTLDLAGVGFMDSSGLGLVLGRAALCEELGATLRVLHPSERILRVFSVAGLERLSHITVEK